MQKFFQRIEYSGELDDISAAICRDFDIGELVTSDLIPVGYEDFNYILETTQGKYFVKVFAKFRNDKNIRRYLDIMLKAVEQGVKFPELYKSNQGYLHETKVAGTELKLCVMQYIDGQSYYLLKQKPNHEEIKFLAHQAALINSIDIKPEFVYDSWAIVNFKKEFVKKSKYLGKGDLDLLEPLVQVFDDIEISTLPHCFVHGDIIVTNVMKDKQGQDWIIDFSVSNYYPRIQEIAVLACNLFFDENNKSESEENLRIALAEYQKTIKLTTRELKSLPEYIKLAHAMHLLSANYEKVAEKNDSEENEYWLNQGRIGLQQMKKGL
ncbi:phosphotransferase [Patescibacteria group bacterium]